MAFNKFQVNAIKKIHEILKLEYFDPQKLQKEIQHLQHTLKNITSNYFKEFSEIKTTPDSEKFVLSYLSKSISEKTFNKIKENYLKTKKITLKTFDPHFEKTNSNMSNGNIFDAIFSGLNHEEFKDLENTLNSANEMLSKSNKDIEKALEQLSKDIDNELKNFPEQARSSAEYIKGLNEGKQSILDQLNLPSVKEINQSIKDWEKQESTPEVQKALKDNRPVKPAKPFLDLVNGNPIMISELKANSITVKDPKKCSLIFIDEDGKVHQLNKNYLQKGKYKLDFQKGLTQDNNDKIKNRG